jgi:hypothetical protein
LRQLLENTTMLQSKQTGDKDDLEITEVRYQQPGGQVVRNTDLGGTVAVGSPFTVIVQTAAARVEGRAVNLSTGQEYAATSSTQVDSDTWELSFEVGNGATVVIISADSTRRVLYLGVGLAITIVTHRIRREAGISIPHAGDTVNHQFTASGTYQDPLSVLQACIDCDGNKDCVPATKTSRTTWEAKFDTMQRGTACALSIEDTAMREPGQTISPITVV